MSFKLHSYLKVLKITFDIRRVTHIRLSYLILQFITVSQDIILNSGNASVNGGNSPRIDTDATDLRALNPCKSVASVSIRGELPPFTEALRILKICMHMQVSWIW